MAEVLVRFSFKLFGANHLFILFWSGVAASTACPLVTGMASDTRTRPPELLLDFPSFIRVEFGTVRKMYTDVPRFNRCCFCFPLRYSLLVWGCITLGLNLFEVYYMADTLHYVLSSRTTDDSLVQMENFMIVLCASEVVARSIYVFVAIILIIAALKKHEKLFRFVYYCSMVDLVYLFVYGIYIITMTIHIQVTVMPMATDYILRSTIRDIIMTGGAIFIEGYTMLLIRSELYKLQERSKIQFTNSAVEAQVIVETLEQN